MCLRTAFGVNVNREEVDRGADTPLFTPFYKNVKALFPHPLEPSFPGLRTEIGGDAVRREGELGCGGRWG